MADTRTRYVPPSISELAFNCPHCGALAKQFWFTTNALKMESSQAPVVFTEEFLKTIPFEDFTDVNVREHYRNWAKRKALGHPFLGDDVDRRSREISNFNVSECFNCHQISLWLYNKLLWPQHGEAPLPSSDLPENIKRDYDEASVILNASPRGAAALLRLCVQKLCKELGEKGKNIDEDIAALVKKGLDIRVQRALDVVRVVGNNAVHPGQIDLSDDRATAEELFKLVNLIVEIMISQPKHIEEMFARLPETALKAIERRDGG
ncbi:DUF4145 domain-containing protein [Hyphomonas sp.]|uniref:DUF4145 domain-containing protein n=1 Tax=Hyphomonas sp. TaxID=87 RepID=UPI0025B97621|nr:DUF4145 domain-containing protein [Hyphomonas sp.]